MRPSYTNNSYFWPFSGHMSLTRISMSSRATTISRKLSSRFSPRLLIRSIVMGWRFPGLFSCVEVYAKRVRPQLEVLPVCR